jgi:hypothetical protein
MPVAIDKALTEAGIDLSELDGIAFTRGPGIVDGMLFQDDVGEDFALGGDDCGAGVICRADLSAYITPAARRVFSSARPLVVLGLESSAGALRFVTTRMACCFRTTLARILRSEVTIAAQVSSVVRTCQRVVPCGLVVTKRSAPAKSSPTSS